MLNGSQANLENKDQESRADQPMGASDIQMQDAAPEQVPAPNQPAPVSFMQRFTNGVSSVAQTINNSPALKSAAVTVAWVGAATIIAPAAPVVTAVGAVIAGLGVYSATKAAPVVASHAAPVLSSAAQGLTDGVTSISARLKRKLSEVESNNAPKNDADEPRLEDRREARKILKAKRMLTAVTDVTDMETGETLEKAPVEPTTPSNGSSSSSASASDVSSLALAPLAITFTPQADQAKKDSEQSEPEQKKARVEEEVSNQEENSVKASTKKGRGKQKAASSSSQTPTTRRSSRKPGNK